MKRTRLPFIALAALLVLGSTCGSGEIWAGLDPSSTPDVPVIDFGRSSDQSGTADIDWIDIQGYDLASRQPPYEQPVTFWRLSPAPTWRYARVNKLIYGTVPASLQQSDSCRAIRANFAYIVQYVGPDFWGGSLYFLVSEDSSGSRSIRELTPMEFDSLVWPPQ
jgi:hypothetical protein